jgi:hypothetical protein
MKDERHKDGGRSDKGAKDEGKRGEGSEDAGGGKNAGGCEGAAQMEFQFQLSIWPELNRVSLTISVDGHSDPAGNGEVCAPLTAEQARECGEQMIRAGAELERARRRLEQGRKAAMN